jgi:hypothetical protein
MIDGDGSRIYHGVITDLARIKGLHGLEVHEEVRISMEIEIDS